MTHRPRLTVEEIDCLLNELEKQAASQVSSEEFFSNVLTRFQAVVGGDSVAILVAAGDETLVIRSSGGLLPLDFCKSVTRELITSAKPGPVCFQGSEGDTFFAFPWPHEQPFSGCLAVGYSGNKVSAANPAIVELGTAFAELLQIHSLKKFQELIARRWSVWCKIAESVSQTNSFGIASRVMVDGLQTLLEADRVSLVDASSRSKSKAVIAISGHHFAKIHNAITNSLWEIAMQVCSSKQVLVSASDTTTKVGEHSTTVREAELFRNLIALPLKHDHVMNWKRKSIVIVEWQSKHQMFDGLTTLSLLLSPIGVLWSQQKRWLRFPGWMRAWSEHSAFHRFLRTSLRVGVWLLCLLALGAFANLLLSDKEMLIEADAVVEPTIRRTIFASSDGFIKKLNTDVGNRVIKGEVLVELFSPSLEIQLEGSRGEILAIMEKRKGLEVALSQMSFKSLADESSRTRISAEIALLQSQANALREKLEVLNTEKTRLKLESPIDGTVVSRNLRSELENRPVRRGDALFAVAELNGPWQIQVRVADRDTHYLLSRFSHDEGKVQIILDSLPEKTFDGKISEVGMSLESTQDRGAFLPFIVSIDSQVELSAKIGSTAKVFFSCGSEPLWFVWSRPAVNFAKRNYWFYFSRHNQ